ncbi:uncharacterized protein LOC126891602 [Diabrotica virgifera virgifera]|uniref:HAT C-terminal dimerisation domain-containing protein n=1 Tax=Diabrotica virgifera virgifera TaxID=50390 RepID=A0ABM5L2S5_DIAVI|nr:uncharacterized protein LOC126891602 [Diabrotica virgifera virgifera]
MIPVLTPLHLRYPSVEVALRCMELKQSRLVGIDKSKTITEVSTYDDDRDSILLPLPSTSSSVSISDGNQSGKGETVKSVENSETSSFDCTGGVVFSSDPSLWKINDELRDHVAVHGVYKTVTRTSVHQKDSTQILRKCVKYVFNLREDFDRLENLAKEKSSKVTYKYDERRDKKRKLAFDESRDGEISFNGRDDFKINTFNVILDKLSTELRKRADKYSDIHSIFGFFEDIDLQSSDVITEKANHLVILYPNDLETSLTDECFYLQAYLGQCESSLWEITGDQKVKKTSSISGLYKFLYENGALEMCPNIDIALRMILSAPVSNCSGERSFSTLRRVKNYLRSTMGTERLTALSLLTIEQCITKRIAYGDLIDDFARQKARRKAM